MPTYQVDVGNKTYEVDAPDPNTAWQWANYTHAQPAPKTAGFSLKDLGLSFGQGAVGSTEAITNVAGAGNAASQYLNDVNESLGKQYTPARQAELLRQQERMTKAEQSGSTLEELKAGVQNIAEAPLQSIAQGVGSFVPYIPAIFGGPVAAALGLGERAAVAANLVIKAYAPVVGTAQGAGSVKGAIYDAVYKAEIADKVPEAEARQKADAAQEYTGQNLDQIALGAGLGYIASKGGIEKYFTKEGREHAGQALLPRVGTAIAEESLTEGAQGGQERLASNLALQRTGRDVPTFQGVVGQAFQEGLIGGLTAGPISAFTGGKSKADVEQERLKKEQDQFAEQQKAFVAQQEKTKTNLQVPEMLALPPPSQRIEPVKEEKALTNPLGNITKDELGPEVSGYVEQHRQQNNLPPLQSYSIEDVRDAMTQVNTAGEKGALDSILTAKTGFSGEEKYTPQDVVNAAIEKNVAHETVGFQDFLQRTTGERDLSTMSQPQLYSAFKALSEMKRGSTDEQIVLPEGSNASRFTQDQYDKGRSFVTQQLATGEPLAASPAREALKDVTGLKTDRDVHTLLQTVIKNEDLNVAKVGDDFQITPSTPIKDARAPLPKGYSIEEGTYAEGERPAGFEITPEGRGKPLTTVDLEEEVGPKIERLTGLRQKEAAKMLADVNKYSGVVKAGQTSLDSMEARGLTGTEAYAKEKANQARREDVLNKRIKTLMNRIEEMSAPLKSKPVGTKPVTTKKHTLTKDGKVLGTFPSRLDAEASMLTQLTDAELDTLATDTRFGGITDRAVQEQERRKAPPGMRVKGTEAGLAKAGVYTQSSPEMAELEKNLVAALSKFGLKDVALKVVRAISNNAAGSYEAKLIKIAFDVSNPVGTMRHEAVHALKELGFFTKDQWRILENKAKNEWVQTYLKNKMVEVGGQRMTRYDAYANGVKDENGKTILEPLSPEGILEEAIADAFADFDVNKAPPGMMMALLNKLRNFFKALRQALTGAGFESAEDIFGKIEEGKLESQMDKADKAGKGQEKLSLPEPPKEKIIDPNDISGLISSGPYNDAALRILNSQIPKTSKPLEVDQLGVLFDKAYLDQFGQQGDWKNQSDFQSAVAQAVKELTFQMKQSKSGLDWYDQDIADAFKLTQRYIPSLKKPEKRALFSVIAGIMSPSTNARDNWVIAAQAYQHYEKTGILPGVNPASGVLWMGGLESANKKKQLDMLNAMLQPKSKGGLGEKAAVEWLQGDHSVAEITKFREKYGGMGKSSAGGKATDIVPGYTTFGPKVGPFVMNINGLHEVTVDVWMTRTFNRYFGQMMGSDGKMTRAPTEPQRVVIKRLATEAAKELGIKPYQVQSVLWFFEQQMFNKLGTGAKSYGFSDGAIKFIETQGGVGVSSAPSTNIGSNAPTNQPTGKQNVGVGTQADKPRARADQQATQQGLKNANVSSGEPTARSSTRGKQKFSLSGERRGQREDSRFTPLSLAPSVKGFHGPDPGIVAVAERYAKQNGIDLKRQAEYVQVEGNKDAEDRATRIAKAYEDMRHDPQNPEVKDAYQNLIEQTIAQYEALVDAGYKFWFIDLDNSDNLDYLSSPWNALRDMRSNKQMGIFPTNVGFGSNENFDPSNNPLLQETDFEWPIGGLNGKKQKVLANDVFRAVHDAFGHGLEGAGFRATGEENAWQAHSRLFTGSALKAITSETRGQNSAVNYGPNGEFNRKANPADTIYADQKVGLMPAWTWKEGLSADEPTFQKLNSKKDAQRFLNAVERVKLGRPYAFPLHVHDLDTYKNAKLFLSEDEESGFALIGDEIGSFFSGGRGQAYPTLRLAVDEGGRRIDTYRTKLPSVMGKAHFRPVARVEFNAELATPLWDKTKFKQFQNGKPDLVFYAYDPSFNVSGDKDAGDLAVSKTPLVEYDEAVNLQKDAVKDAKYSLKGINLGEQQPEAQSFSGTHYGNAKVDVLAGSKYGTGIRGAERRRLDNAFDNRIKRRAYFYVAKEDGTMPLPESGLGGHVYTQTFNNILGPGKEMSRLFSKARGDSNDFESNVVDAGYDGYAAPSMGMMVILNHDVPVNYEGTKAEFDAKKPKLSLHESVAVDKNGKPLELYHATYSAFDKPKINYGSDEWRRFGFHVGPLEAAQNRLDIKAVEDKREGVKSGNAGANIIPVYLDIRNPLRLDENRTGRWGVNDIMSAIMEKADKDGNISKTSIDLLPEDVEMYMRDEFPIEAWLKGETDPNSEDFDPNAESRNWSDDSDFGPGEKTKLLLDFLKTLGYDSIVYKNKFEGGGDSYIALNANQVKSQLRPEGKFSLRDIKAEIESMPNGKQIFSAIKGATTTREEKGWAERITSFVTPRSFSQYRAQALDRYNQLSVREKNLAQENGGIERLADSNAHAAALMSDLHAGVTAQVLGVDDGIGGVPVYDKGYTTVSNLNGTVKGPMEIFKRLAAVGDPTIYQAYQFWAAAKRGKRLLGEGREQNIDADGIAFANALEDKYKMFVDIQKDWVKFNNGLVKYQIDTGVISKEMGQEWMKYADYIPFYRQLDGENTAGPKIYQSISGVKPTKKLKGSEAPIADFLETVVRNTHAAVQAGMKNVAAQRAGQLAVQVGIGEKLDGPATGHDIITALENGKQVFYRIGDDLFVDAVTSLNIPELPFISFLTAPSNLLRNLVTKDPGFMLANLMRDSVSAYVTSGANIKPMIDTMQEFTRAARGNSPEFEMLKRAGVVGGYDYSKGVQASTENFAKQLRKRSGTKTKSEQLLSPVTGIWDFLEKGSEASDAATRIAVFKDTLKRTGNEAEALLQSLEVMNFNRKGSSALIRIVTAGVPFLNARMQGLDVLYRAGIRPIFSGTNPTEREKQIQRTFFVRAGMIMGISLMYAMAVKDDPKYEAQEEETKDNNWLIPQLGIRIPTPFEIGFLFKTMPERIYRWGFSGSDTGEEFAASMKRGLVSTFAFNPVPQAVLPITEAISNYSTFTMRPIVGQNLLNIDPQYQVGPSTSVMAEKVGEALGVSPIKIDHIYKGYTGTMGMYLVDTLDTVFDLFSDNPRPAKRFEQMPVLKRFLIDPEAKGNVTAYYAFKHSVDEAVRTVNFLDKRLNKDAGDYQEQKMGLLDYKQYISDMDKQMNALQDESIMIRSSGMPAKEKRDALLDITRIQNEMLSDIRQIKKMAKEQ